MQQPTITKPLPATVPSSYSLIINVSAVVLLTGLLTIMLHECAHFVPAYWFGFQPELHHNFVYYNDTGLPTPHVLIVAGSGPVFSGLLGWICLTISKRIRQKGILSLLLFWMGLHGLLTFFGYLFIAPFFIDGDTGKVFSLLGLPFWSVLLISGLSIGMMIVLFKRQVSQLRYYGSTGMTVAQRANTLILLPIFVDMASSLLHLPVTVFFSLLSPLTMPLSFMALYGTFRRTIQENPTVPLDRLRWPLLILTLFVVVLFRLLHYPVGSPPF